MLYERKQRLIARLVKRALVIIALIVLYVLFKLFFLVIVILLLIPDVITEMKEILSGKLDFTNDHAIGYSYVLDIFSVFISLCYLIFVLHYGGVAAKTAVAELNYENYEIGHYYVSIFHTFKEIDYSHWLTLTFINDTANFITFLIIFPYFLISIYLTYENKHF